MTENKNFGEEIVKRLTGDYSLTISDAVLARNIIQSSFDIAVNALLRQQRLELTELVAQCDNIDDAALSVLRHE